MGRIADIYSLPPSWGPQAPNTTIESIDWNTVLPDIEFDLNAARPIIAGGTGATTAIAARGNLAVERSGQQITNYDSTPWENGSFWSLAGATGAPSANAFSGTAIAYGGDPLGYILIEAFDVITGNEYRRIKIAGSWSSWANVSIGNYVLKAGDTMTGALTIAPVTTGNSALVLNKPRDIDYNIITGQKAGTSRWAMYFGDNTAESGSNVGSDFYISAQNDAGAYLWTALYINRATGNVGFSAIPTAYGAGFKTVAMNGAVACVFDLQVGGTRAGSFAATSTAVNLMTLTGVPLTFYTNGAEKVRIDINGNLGIGTTGPMTKLDVQTAANKHLLVRSASDIGGSPTSVMLEAVNDGAASVIGLYLEGGPLELNRIAGQNINAGTGKFTVLGQLDVGNGGLPLANKACIVDSVAPSVVGVLTVTNTYGAAGVSTMVLGGGVNGADSATVMMRMMDGSITATVGSITRTGTNQVAYNTSSDERFKPIRERMLLSAGREKINALEIWNYDFEGNDIRGVGGLAQQFYAVDPSFAHKPYDEEQLWQYEKAAPMPYVILNLQSINEDIAAIKTKLGMS